MCMCVISNVCECNLLTFFTQKFILFCSSHWSQQLHSHRSVEDVTPCWLGWSVPESPHNSSGTVFKTVNYCAKPHWVAKPQCPSLLGWHVLPKGTKGLLGSHTANLSWKCWGPKKKKKKKRTQVQTLVLVEQRWILIWKWASESIAAKWQKKSWANPKLRQKQNVKLKNWSLNLTLYKYVLFKVPAYLTAKCSSGCKETSQFVNDTIFIVIMHLSFISSSVYYSI